MKWQDSILCQLKLKELILYLILSIDCCSIKMDTTWIANKVSMLTWLKTPSEMSETQWPHTVHILLNQEKEDNLIFSVMAIFQILDVSVFKTGCFGFYWLVPNG
jgi:hypothetical protein